MLSRIFLDERSSQRTDVYLTVHNNHNIYPRPLAGLDLAILASERQKTLALDRAGNWNRLKLMFMPNAIRILCKTVSLNTYTQVINTAAYVLYHFTPTFP
jgi:hypothetical protein